MTSQFYLNKNVPDVNRLVMWAIIPPMLAFVFLYFDPYGWLDLDAMQKNLFLLVVVIDLGIIWFFRQRSVALKAQTEVGGPGFSIFSDGIRSPLLRKGELFAWRDMDEISVLGAGKQMHLSITPKKGLVTGVSLTYFDAPPRDVVAALERACPFPVSMSQSLRDSLGL